MKTAQVDFQSVLPMIAEVEEVNGQAPDITLADSGYKSEENFKSLIVFP